MDWSEGYVTGVGYVRGYHRELAANWQSHALAAAGYEAPNINAPFTKVELGCGYGLTLLMEAAAYPHAQFFGVDFNPNHITWAKRIAAQAGLDNVHFLEMSFADLLGSPIPDADYVTMHGVWTWVSEENRTFIKRFLDRRLKSGGVTMISYNTLPGWSAKSAVRELMVGKFRSTTGPLAQRVKESLDFAVSCRDLGISIFHLNPVLSEHIDQLKKMPYQYIAHEYLNQDWHLFYHHQVVNSLSDIRLSFMASAKTVDNFDQFNFVPAMKSLLDKVSPQERETMKDIQLNRTFRYDLYGRGIEPIGLIGTAGEILNSRFVLSDGSVKTFEGKLKAPVGEISLKPALYEPIMERLKKGPAYGRDFVMQPGPRPLSVGDVTYILSIFMDLALAYPALPEDTQHIRAQRAHRLNEALIERTAKGEEISYLLSPVSGIGHQVRDFEQFVISALNNGKDPFSQTLAALKTLGRRMMKDGKVLEDPEENQRELKSRLQDFETTHRTLWTQLGLLKA